MPQDDIRDQLFGVLARAYKDGSPIAYPGTRKPSIKWAEMADIAIRRYTSFERRNKKRDPSRADRIEDLAQGLRDAYEREPHLVGPLIDDYRDIAQEIADIPEQAKRIPGRD